MMKSRCDQCGAEIQDNAKYCINCGCQIEYHNGGYLFPDTSIYARGDDIQKSASRFLEKYASSEIYDKLLTPNSHILSDWGAKLYVAETDIYILERQLKTIKKCDLGGVVTDIDSINQEINQLINDYNRAIRWNKKNADALSTKVSKEKERLEKKRAKKIQVESKICAIEEKLKVAIKRRDNLIEHIKTINSFSVSSF